MFWTKKIIQYCLQYKNIIIISICMFFTSILPFIVTNYEYTKLEKIYKNDNKSTVNSIIRILLQIMIPIIVYYWYPKTWINDMLIITITNCILIASAIKMKPKNQSNEILSDSLGTIGLSIILALIVQIFIIIPFINFTQNNITVYIIDIIAIVINSTLFSICYKTS